MRKALNENPVVQIVVIGVMAVLVAFLLFTRVLNQGGGEEAAAPTDSGTAATEASATPAPETSAPAPAAESATPAPSGAVTPAPEAVAPPTTGSTAAPAAPSAGATSAFVPGPGLPEKVVVAYARNQAVVLLVAKRKGLDDQALALNSLFVRARSDVKAFHVPVKEVAKYARITEGVDLNRTPAIVVLLPRKLTDNVPEATISYGYRGPESIQQAVDDALYDGKNVTYDP